MNKFLWSLSFALLSPLALAAAEDPQEIAAPVDRIFIPLGFDDNDNVEVVIHGNFNDTCHTVGRASADVDLAKGVVTIKATSYRYPGKICLQTITPFIQTVSLGLVPEGNYKVQYANDQNVRQVLTVAKRKTESADDYLYASVENANIDVNAESGKQALQLSGHFPHFFVGCMVIREVRTSIAPADVVVVQPIAEVIDTEECNDQPADRSFNVTVGIKEAFRGEGLLHVRTLNGNSINRYLDIN